MFTKAKTIFSLSLAESWLVHLLFIFGVQLLPPYFTATLLMRDICVGETYFPHVSIPSTEIRPCLPRQKVEHIYLAHEVTSVRCPLTEAELFSSSALYQMERLSEHNLSMFRCQFAKLALKARNKKRYQRNLCWHSDEKQPYDLD